MPKVTPTEGADKLKRGISSHGTDYQAGINKVSVNPAEQAAANEDKWFASLSDAYTNKRFSKGLGRVTLAGWKAAVMDGGVSRYTQSADKAAKNYAAFAQQFYPFLQSVQDQISAMPNRSLQDNIQRMIANVNMIHEFKNR